MIKILKYVIPTLAVLLLSGCSTKNDSLVYNTNLEVNYDYNYIADEVDEWATLEEFRSKGGGDCEDYAVAKYTILTEELGVPKNRFQFLMINRNHIVLEYIGDNDTLYLDLDDYTQMKPSWLRIEVVNPKPRRVQ